MWRLRVVVLALVLLAPACTNTVPGSASDTREIEQLPARFSEAWAKHDGHALAALMAEDVDFINVGASWLHGRKDFETYHSRLLDGRFKGSTITPLEHRVKFLRPDIAALRWSWRIEGDRDPDGTPRLPRNGMFTMIVEKKDGGWWIVAAQNTNAGPGTAPENEGLVFPIAIPR